MATPKGGSLGNNPIAQQPSRTYKINFETGRIDGMIDEIDAVKQAVQKVLQTERFEHLIYSGGFGSELSTVIGSDRATFPSDVKKAIRAALIRDDRIRDLQEWNFEYDGDTATVTFTVVTQFGSFQNSFKISQ